MVYYTYMEVFNFLDAEKEYVTALAERLEENETLKETVTSLMSQLQKKEEYIFHLKTIRGTIHVAYCVI